VEDRQIISDAILDVFSAEEREMARMCDYALHIATFNVWRCPHNTVNDFKEAIEKVMLLIIAYGLP